MAAEGSLKPYRLPPTTFLHDDDWRLSLFFKKKKNSEASSLALRIRLDVSLSTLYKATDWSRSDWAASCNVSHKPNDMMSKVVVLITQGILAVCASIQHPTITNHIIFVVCAAIMVRTRRRENASQQALDTTTTTTATTTTTETTDPGSPLNVDEASSPAKEKSPNTPGSVGSPKKKKKKKKSPTKKGDSPSKAGEEEEEAKDTMPSPKRATKRTKASPSNKKKTEPPDTKKPSKEEEEAVLEKKKKKQTKNKDKNANEAEDTVMHEADSSKEEEEDRSSKHQKKTTRRDEENGSKNDQEKTRTSNPPPLAMTTTTTTMDVAVHRMRHLSYRPAAILCLESTPFHKDACDYVALSRDNGSIELKSPDEKWRTVTSVAGMPTRPVNCLAWICGTTHNPQQPEQQPEPMQISNNNKDVTNATTSFASAFHQSHTRIHARRTLVGASKDGTIFQIDFGRGRCTNVTGSGGGGVFSLVSLCGAQCGADHENCSRLVAAGCEDGSVRVYQLQDNEDDPVSKPSPNRSKLRLVSTIPCAGSSILSLAWRASPATPGKMEGSVLYAGVADGTIRRYDCQSSVAHAKARGTIVGSSSSSGEHRFVWQSAYRMTVESYGRTTPTRVWALCLLTDGTVVSGDSLGHVQFWDGDSGTLVQSFDQNDHKADVLALTVTHDESRVFASGVDSRVVCIQRQQQQQQHGSRLDAEWILTNAQRPHTHDVRALTVCRVQDRTGTLERKKRRHDGTEAALPVETMCSGGIDTKLCSYLIREFRKTRPRSWFPWPTVSPFAVAQEARTLLMMREDKIELHQIGPETVPEETTGLVPDEDTLIGTMDVKGTHNLVCADMAPNGKLLCLCSGTKTLLFAIEYVENEDGSLGFLPHQIKLPSSLSGSSSLVVKFVSNTQIACLSNQGVLRFATIVDERVVDTVRFDTTMADSAMACHTMTSSDDGKWLAMVRSGVESGVVQVWSVPNKNAQDVSGHYWWSVPALEAPISTVSFLQSSHGSTQLAVACSNFAFYVFDVAERRLGDWSEQHGFPVTKSLPPHLQHQPDFPVRIVGNPKDSNKFLVVSGLFLSCCVRQDRYSGLSWTLPLFWRRVVVIVDRSVCQSCDIETTLFRPSMVKLLS